MAHYVWLASNSIKLPLNIVKTFKIKNKTKYKINLTVTNHILKIIVVLLRNNDKMDSTKETALRTEMAQMTKVKL